MFFKRVIVGLGNVGQEYAMTRHNVGWMVADALAADMNFSFVSRKLSLVAEGEYGGQEWMLLKPLTFMNRSGLALQDLVQQGKIRLENILVICDDVELDFGVIRVRPLGGTGGHNGLKSIVEACGSNAFGRLRVGVGRGLGGDLAAHVLSPFTSQEQKDLKDVVKRATAAIYDLGSHSWAEVMARYNARTV